MPCRTHHLSSKPYALYELSFLLNSEKSSLSVLLTTSIQHMRWLEDATTPHPVSGSLLAIDRIDILQLAACPRSSSSCITQLWITAIRITDHLMWHTQTNIRTTRLQELNLLFQCMSLPSISPDLLVILAASASSLRQALQVTASPAHCSCPSSYSQPRTMPVGQQCNEHVAA